MRYGITTNLLLLTMLKNTHNTEAITHPVSIYGLQSYISFPIILKNGTFFGTLCAIDSKPAELNNTKVIGMFTMFAELLSFHLQSADLLERTHQETLRLHHENKALTNAKFYLDNFV